MPVKPKNNRTNGAPAFFVALCAALTAAGSARAQKAPLAAPSPNERDPAAAAMLSASEQVLQALQSKSEGTWKVSRDRDTGLPRMLMGAKWPSHRTTAAEAAQAFLAENADLFLPGNSKKPQDERIALKASSPRALPGSAVVEFHEEYKGIPVRGASVTVMVNSSGNVTHVTSTLTPRAIVPALPGKTFREIDSLFRDSRTNPAIPFAVATNALVILPGNPPRLAYQALCKVGGLREPWLYLFDADTGQTLQAVRLVQEDAAAARHMSAVTYGRGGTALPLRRSVRESVQGLRNEEDRLDPESRADKPVATCKVHVDLTSENDVAAAEASEPTASGTGARRTLSGGVKNTSEAAPGAATTYAVYGCVTDLVGGDLADSGYYSTYSFRIGIDADASPGPATVYAKLICDTTGQRWRTDTSWTIQGTECDSRYFLFDDTVFSAKVYGNRSLDFTVEIWTSGDAGRSPEKTALHDKPAGTSSPKASSRTRVFDPNPVNTLNDTSLTDQSDADAAVPTNAYVEVDLAHLASPSSPGGNYSLVGLYAKMEDIEEPANTPPSSPTPVFSYLRNDDAFEEVMCYYHVTRNQDYIQSLGLTNVNNRQQRMDAHGCGGAGNAYYKVDADAGFPSGAGFLVFGDGGVDKAEDADAILHEYGHSLQDNSSAGKYLGWTHDRGYGDETRSMAEGFADYWACSCTYTQSVANGFDPAVVGEWALPSSARRRVDNGNHYPEDMQSNAYEDCQIWSACLWDISKAIGRGPTDRIVLTSHFLVPAGPCFEDGANAVLAADNTLYGATNYTRIRAIFVARGILRDDTVVWSGGGGGADTDNVSPLPTTYATPTAASSGSVGSDTKGRKSATGDAPAATPADKGPATFSAAGSAAGYGAEQRPSIGPVAQLSANPRSAPKGATSDAIAAGPNTGTPAWEGECSVGYRTFSVSDDAGTREQIGNTGNAGFAAARFRVRKSCLLEFGYGLCGFDEHSAGEGGDAEGAAAWGQLGYRFDVRGDPATRLGVRLDASAGYVDFFGLERSTGADVGLQGGFYVQPRIELVYRFGNGWYAGIGGSYEHYFSSDLDNGWSATLLVGYAGTAK